jgi:Zn-dependent protease
MFDRLFSHPEQILYSLPGILIGLVLHELAHAFVADRLGDPTPRLMGRLTLNPLKHIDPIGFAMLIFIGFGWAKPVITNPAMYKKFRKHGFALVGIAGVLTNLLMALVFLFAINLIVVGNIISIDYVNGLIKNEYLFYILYYAVSINVMLALFNLIPIPPLDGYNIFKNLVLIKYVNAKSLWNFERYGQFILLGALLLVTYIWPSVLGNAIQFIVSLLNSLVTLIFPFLKNTLLTAIFSS